MDDIVRERGCSDGPSPRAMGGVGTLTTSGLHPHLVLRQYICKLVPYLGSSTAGAVLRTRENTLGSNVSHASSRANYGLAYTSARSSGGERSGSTRSARSGERANHSGASSPPATAMNSVGRRPIVCPNVPPSATPSSVATASIACVLACSRPSAPGGATGCKMLALPTV